MTQANDTAPPAREIFARLFEFVAALVNFVAGIAMLMLMLGGTYGAAAVVMGWPFPHFLEGRLAAAVLTTMVAGLAYIEWSRRQRPKMAPAADGTRVREIIQATVEDQLKRKLPETINQMRSRGQLR